MGLLNRWNKVKKSTKGNGFDQPVLPRQHWHTDIKQVNFRGTFLFLISVIDGCSRYIVHHELRTNIQEYDIQITVQRALEKYPSVKPRLITDNGSQYISKDFAEYLKLVGLQHIRTSIAYPQSNGKIERYHRTIHEECLATKSLIDLDDARQQIAGFIEYYNTKRLHSSLFYLTPNNPSLYMLYINSRFFYLSPVRQMSICLSVLVIVHISAARLILPALLLHSGVFHYFYACRSQFVFD